MIGSFITTIPSLSCVPSCAEFFGMISNHPGDSAPLQPRFGTLWLVAFPKTKITFEREEISDCRWQWGKYDRAAGVIGRNVLGPKVPKEGDWGVIVLCTMSLVSCLFNKCLSFTFYGWIPSEQNVENYRITLFVLLCNIPFSLYIHLWWIFCFCFLYNTQKWNSWITW